VLSSVIENTHPNRDKEGKGRNSIVWKKNLT